MSPSVWWNHKSILGYLNEHAPQVWERPRIWLDVGDREGQKALRDVEQVRRLQPSVRRSERFRTWRRFLREMAVRMN